MLRRSVSVRGVAAPAKARTGATVAGHFFWGSTSKSEPRTRPSEALPRAPALSGEYRLRLSRSAPGLQGFLERPIRDQETADRGRKREPTPGLSLCGRPNNELCGGSRALKVSTCTHQTPKRSSQFLCMRFPRARFRDAEWITAG